MYLTNNGVLYNHVTNNGVLYNHVTNNGVHYNHDIKILNWISEKKKILKMVG